MTKARKLSSAKLDRGIGVVDLTKPLFVKLIP